MRFADEVEAEQATGRDLTDILDGDQPAVLAAGRTHCPIRRLVRAHGTTCSQPTLGHRATPASWIFPWMQPFAVRGRIRRGRRPVAIARAKPRRRPQPARRESAGCYARWVRPSIWQCAVFVLVALASWAASSTTHACDCKPAWPVDKALSRSEMVFEGRVVEEREDDDGERIHTRFEVKRVFKGDRCTPLEVITPGHLNSCMRRYALGETYLIYAYDSGDEELSDSFCSRSRLVTKAKEDFAVLGPGQLPSCQQDLDAPAPQPLPVALQEPKPAPESAAPDDKVPEPALKQRGCAATVVPPPSPAMTTLLIASLLGMTSRRRR